jgi:thiamine phosphate synthase YjbQ (UPF0047 family)
VTHQDRIQLETAGHGDMHDVTGHVQRIVSESNIGVGTVHVFNVGSTAVVGGDRV